MTSITSINGQLSQAKKIILPSTLEGFRDYHNQDTIIVCGCGKSLGDFVEYDQFVTIGVNDVGRLFDPTYLVVLNDRAQFYGDRFEYVARSGARALFWAYPTQIWYDLTWGSRVA